MCFISSKVTGFQNYNWEGDKIIKGNIKEDKNVPTIFTAIASAAIGALAGLLAPSPRNSNQ